MMIDHLGDGVYVKAEHGQIVLMANNHISPTDTIYLEPHVYEALLRFVLRVERAAVEHERREA